MIQMDWNLVLAILALASTVLASVWTLSLWLSRQFSQVKTLVYDKSEQIQTVFAEKLDYHEKHDDQRFSQMTNDLWEIRLSNAARFGFNGKRPKEDPPKES